MLNDYQIMVVRRAMAAAVDKDAEIKRIAKGMKVEESEIQQVWAQTPREEPAAKANSVPAGRALWTTKRLEQLHQLRAEKKGPAEIARIMGLKTHQVQSKLHSEKKSRSAAKPSTPVSAGDDPPAAPPGLPAESKPVKESVTGLAACEPESLDTVESLPVESKVSASSPLSDAVRAFSEAARIIFPESSIETEDPVPKDDFESVLAQQEEQRPFILASEIMSLIKYLEYSFPPVSMGLLQANQAAGWATCRFTAAGERYMISLRREEQKA